MIKINFSGSIIVSQLELFRIRLVYIKEFLISEVEQTFYIYSRIQDNSFVITLAAFNTENLYYIVFEHILISFTYIVYFSLFPTERILAAILGQARLLAPS